MMEKWNDGKQAYAYMSASPIFHLSTIPIFQPYLARHSWDYRTQKRKVIYRLPLTGFFDQTTDDVLRAESFCLGSEGGENSMS